MSGEGGQWGSDDRFGRDWLEPFEQKAEKMARDMREMEREIQGVEREMREMHKQAVESSQSQGKKEDEQWGELFKSRCGACSRGA